MDGSARRARRAWLTGVALALIVAFGAWTRASGFTRGSLWFDDAWTALPARVSLSTAVRMITTAPGYTVGLRTWLRLVPAATWWAQLPAFVAGLAGIVAVFALLRYFSTWWPLPYAGALAVAASPVAVNYSTRVKQFGFDLLLACLLLWLLERWRRTPSTRGAVELAVGSVLSLLVSTTTVVVALAVAATVLLAALGDRRRRRDAVVVVGATGATTLVAWVVWLRHLSPSLHFGWTKRGYLLSTSSLHRVAFSFEAMGTGLFHWMVGTPLGRGLHSTAVTSASLAVAVAAALVLCALVVPPLVELVRRRTPGPYVASSLAVSLAVLLAIAGRSPFGGGRTDEVLYPSILLLAAGVVTVLAGRLSASMRRVALAVVVVVAGCLVGVGATNRAAYPTTDLRPLAAALDRQLRPGDVVVVDPWLSFTWAYDGLSLTAVSFGHTLTAWSNGYHVVSLDPGVVLSRNAFFPDASFPPLSSRASRLWYVAVTLGHQSSVANHPNRLEVTPEYADLLMLGWRPAGVYLTAAHTEAVLLVYRPTTRR